MNSGAVSLIGLDLVQGNSLSLFSYQWQRHRTNLLSVTVIDRLLLLLQLLSVCSHLTSEQNSSASMLRL